MFHHKLKVILGVLFCIYVIHGETVKYGNYAPLDYYGLYSPNFFEGQYYYVERPILLTHLGAVFGSGTDGVAVQMALYDYTASGPNNGPAPSNLITQVTGVVSTGPTQFPVPGITLNSGYYYVHLVTNANFNISLSYNQYNCTVNYVSFTYGTAFPAYYSSLSNTYSYMGEAWGLFLVGETTKFGNAGHFNDFGWFTPGYLIGFQTSVPKTSLVTQLGLYTNCTGIDFRIGLYDDFGGVPGKLLSQGAGTISGLVTEVDATPQITIQPGLYYLMVQYRNDCMTVELDFSISNTLYMYSMENFSIPLSVNFSDGTLNSYSAASLNYYLVTEPYLMDFGYPFQQTGYAYMGVNSILAMPLYVDRPVTVYSLGFTTYLGNFSYSIGLYADNSSYPGALITSTSGNTTGFQQIVTVPTVVIQPGNYWIAFGLLADYTGYDYGYNVLYADYNNYEYQNFYWAGLWNTTNMPSAFPLLTAPGVYNYSDNPRLNVFIEGVVPNSSPSPTPTHSPSPSTSPAAQKNNTKLIAIAAGAGGAGLLLVAAICIAAFVVIRKKKRSQDDNRAAGVEMASPPAAETDTHYVKIQPSNPSSPVTSNQSIQFASNSKLLPSNTNATSTYYSSTASAIGALDRPGSTTVQSGSSWEIPMSQIQFEHKIGRGAYGEVFKGKWRGIHVAIKKIVVENQDEESVMRDFFTEAELMKRLRPHSNITQLLGIVTTPFCIVTEFVANGSLVDFLQSGKEISNDLKVSIATGIAAGMLHLHQEGIIHRDLACRNILLDKMYNPKVSDFGMSRPNLEYSNRTSKDIGPVRWMAPEAMLEKVYNTKTDVWSYGVVLFEICTRKEPYQGMDLVNVATNVALRKVSLLSYLDSKTVYPPVLVKLMEKCLQHEHYLRPEFDHIYSILDTPQ